VVNKVIKPCLAKINRFKSIDRLLINEISVAPGSRTA
jgi:hypothetical protein